MLILGSPILLAGLGGLYCERAGIVNIGLEGMMTLGTWSAAWAGIQWGPWAGLAFGIVGGAVGGLLHAIATVGFGVDHIVSGVAINILAPGITRYLSSKTFAQPADESPVGGGSISTSPSVGRRPPRRDAAVPVRRGPVRLEDAEPVRLDRGQGLVLHLRPRRVAARPHHEHPAARRPRHRPRPVHGLAAVAHAVRPPRCGRPARTPSPPTPSACGCTGTRRSPCLVSGGCAGFGGAMLVLQTTGNYKENRSPAGGSSASPP